VSVSVGQTVAIGQSMTVDEDGHVGPQLSLFVNDVPAQPGILRKDRSKGVPNGRTMHLTRWALHIPLQVRCECDSRHGNTQLENRSLPSSLHRSGMPHAKGSTATNGERSAHGHVRCYSR